MDLSINRDYRSGNRLPLFLQYSGQLKPQPAYIEVMPDGRVIPGVNPEIGNAVPEGVWNGRIIRIPVPNLLTASGLDALLADVTPLIEEMLDHFEVDWDGSNQVGRFDERGRQLHEKLTFMDFSDYDMGGICVLEALSGVWHGIVSDYSYADDKAAWFEEFKDDLWIEHKEVLWDESAFIEYLDYFSRH